jgi:hypothetical protein
MKFEPRFDTRQASTFLTERGWRTAPATLNKKRCVGGGPKFELFGRRPLYTERALLEWAQARTTPPLRSTSDPTGSAAGARRRDPVVLHAKPYSTQTHHGAAADGDDASSEFIGRRNRSGR